VTVAQKAVFSFVLSALLVGGVTALAYTGVLDLLENRFYNPSASEALIRETARDARLLGEYLAALQNRFSSLLSVRAVRLSFLPAQDAQDVYEQSRLFGELLESIPALQSVRFIDSAGSRIHFSTHPADVAHSDSSSITYRGYNEDPANLPFEEVSVREGSRLTLDSAGGRIIFSFPLYDSFSVYQGVALFTVSARVLGEAFATAGKRGVGENIVLVANPAGLIDVIPGMFSEAILEDVAAIWAGGYRSIVPFVTPTAALALVSVPMDKGLYFGRIVNESALYFSQSAKNLVVATIFLTLFLIIFFLLNFRQGSSAAARGGTAPACGVPQEAADGTPGRGLLSAAKARKAANIDSNPPCGKTIVLEELEAAEADDTPAEAGHGAVEVVSPFDSMFSSLGEMEDIQNGNGAADFVQPFAAASGGPKPPPQASGGKVIVEKDGVPYINSTAVSDDGNTEKIDNNFIRLVNSVVHKA